MSTAARRLLEQMAYPRSIPSEVPAGRVLVHNNVKPARRQGTRGFRFWLQKPDAAGLSPLCRCTCTWAPEVEAHYTRAA